MGVEHEQGYEIVLPPINRLREPAGSSRETFSRPELPSGKAKVRSFVVMVGAGMAISDYNEIRSEDPEVTLWAGRIFL